MEMMCNRPRIEPEAVPALVKQLYGIDVSNVIELDGYDDKNFRVEWINSNTTPHEDFILGYERDQFMLKIINKELSIDLEPLDMKNDILHHLANANFPSPRIVKNKNGTYQSVIELVNADTGKKDVHVVKMFEYIKGIRMDKICMTTQLCRQTGELTGQLNKLLMTFPVHEYDNLDKLNILWNLSEVPKVRKSFQHVQDQSRLPLIEEIVSDFETNVLANSGTFSKGLIHSDINDQNLIAMQVDKTRRGNCMKLDLNKRCENCVDGSYTIIGMIDFGDITYSCHLFDLAIACAYSTLNNVVVDGFEAVKAVIEGYLEHMTLPMNECQHLRVAICSRFVQSFVYSQTALSVDNPNEYTQNHSVYCWPRIHEFWRVSNEEFLQRVGLSADLGDSKLPSYSSTH